MPQDNITRFPTKDAIPENPVTVEDDRNYCRHPAITLNQHDRTVTCVGCQANLDPFAYLLGEANAIRSAWENHRMVNAKSEELRQRIRLLDKEAKRLSASVRRLRAKEITEAKDFRKPL